MSGWSTGQSVLIAVLVLMAAARTIWIGDYLRRCWTATAGSPRRARQAWSGILRTTNQLQEGTPERHQKLLDLESRRLDTMLVGGSIGLAAWSQLFVSSGSAPASRLSGLTVGLLFAGSFALVCGPLLWRSEGLHLTMMGRTATLHVGFGVIALSLASAVLDLDLPVAGFAAVCVAVLIGLRDVAEVRTWIQHVHPALRY
jgi:hypothetical protein